MVISGLFTLIGRFPQKSPQLHFYIYFTLTPSMVTKNPRTKKVQYQAYDFYLLFFLPSLLDRFRKRGVALTWCSCWDFDLFGVISNSHVTVSFPAIFMTTTLIQWGWMGLDWRRLIISNPHLNHVLFSRHFSFNSCPSWKIVEVPWNRFYKQMRLPICPSHSKDTAY